MLSRTCASLKLIERILKRVSVIFIGPWIADIHIHHQPVDRLRRGLFDDLTMRRHGCGWLGLKSPLRLWHVLVSRPCVDLE